MNYVIIIPDFGRKKEPKDVELLYQASKEFYSRRTIDSFKQIFTLRPEYAWLAEKEENILSETDLKEKKIGNIIKGVYFTKTRKGWMPISHYKYILIERDVAYIDFITSFLIGKGITKHLFPKMVDKMKKKGVKKIKLVPYSKLNHKIFKEKFGFKDEGDFLVKHV